MNAREQLAAAAHWLSYQHEDLSFGLKTPEDGLKLWRYAAEHDAELAEFCDEACGEPGDWKPAHFKAAIGYNPFKRAMAAYAAQDVQDAATRRIPQMGGQA